MLKEVRKMRGAVMHWEIAGPDAAALREFYGKMFGWDMTPAGPEYTLVAPVDSGLGGGIMQTRMGMPSYVTVYLTCDDLEATLAEITALGGNTVVPPTAIDADKSFAMFTDPAGNVIGLMKIREA
jgi:predicted enzyme related to lactoylglutathione lyase